MTRKNHIFALEAEADPLIWQLMNLYLHLYNIDGAGEVSGMEAVAHQAGQKRSMLRLESSKPSAQIKLCLYVIPVEMPESRHVADSPPLDLTLKVTRNGEVIETLQRKINRWGGDQIIGKAFR